MLHFQSGRNRDLDQTPQNTADTKAPQTSPRMLHQTSGRVVPIETFADPVSLSYS